MTVLEAVVAVVVALIGLAGTIATRALVPYLRAQLGEANLVKALEIAQVAVAAVEQLAPGAGDSAREKFADALDRARSLAAAHGIDLTDEQWQTLIERAVYEIQDIEMVLDGLEVYGDEGQGVGPATEPAD